MKALKCFNLADSAECWAGDGAVPKGEALAVSGNPVAIFHNQKCFDYWSGQMAVARNGGSAAPMNGGSK